MSRWEIKGGDDKRVLLVGRCIEMWYSSAIRKQNKTKLLSGW